MSARKLQHVSLCDDCKRTLSGGWHYSDDDQRSAFRCPDYIKARCGVCGGTGWDTRDPLDPRACTHQETRAAVERADNDRICPSHEWGYGRCGCPS